MGVFAVVRQRQETDARCDTRQALSSMMLSEESPCGQSKRDWRIWRRGRGQWDAGGCEGESESKGAGDDMDPLEEVEEVEEVAEAVLTAVFLNADSVERLSSAIPFARESADLQLRLIVHDFGSVSLGPEAEACGRCIGP